jgi:hypothetical protein
VSKQRKQRSYSRLKKQDRIAAARLDAERREVALFALELEVKRLEKIPASSRDEKWSSLKEEADKRLAEARAVIAATDSAADGIAGKKQTAGEKNERGKRVQAQRADLIQANIDTWESTMAGHERNLDRLEAVPEAQRADWHGSLEGEAYAPVVDPSSGQPTDMQATWDAAWSYNEKCLDDLERARDTAQEMLAAESPNG